MVVFMVESIACSVIVECEFSVHQNSHPKTIDEDPYYQINLLHLSIFLFFSLDRDFKLRRIGKIEEKKQVRSENPWREQSGPAC